MKTPFSFAFPKDGMTNASILNIPLDEVLRWCIVSNKIFTILVLYSNY